MFADETQPNVTDFKTFIYGQGMATADLPADSVYILHALEYAQNIVLVPSGNVPQVMYLLAVYNLGLHQLIKTAPDQTGRTFFSDSRAGWKLLSMVSGPVVSSSDQGTSQNLLNPEWMDTMSLSTMDYIKTPWGREYLAYAQSYGPTIVDLT